MRLLLDETFNSHSILSFDFTFKLLSEEDQNAAPDENRNEGSQLFFLGSLSMIKACIMEAEVTRLLSSGCRRGQTGGP